MRSIVVTGYPRQAAYLSNLLTHTHRARAVAYSDTRLGIVGAALHAMHADASIAIGGPRPNAFVRMICENRNRPAIVLWVGTDVLRFAQRSHELEPILGEQLVHWACAPHLVGELQEHSINARYVPIASAAVPPYCSPMPATFSVLTYLPHPGRAFYGQRHVWEAARMLPDVPFVVVGRAGPPEPSAPSNVKYLGEVADIDARLDAASVLLRLPEHDGLSVMVVEALARGRHVVWNHPFPGVIHANSAPEAIGELMRLREAHRRGILNLNETGLHHVAEHYAPSLVADNIAAALETDIVSARSTQRPPRSKVRLAVSCQEALSARVAENFSKYDENIAGSFLTTPTMSDTVVSAWELARSDVWYTIRQPFAPKALELAALLSRKRRVVHWLGDDVNALEADAALVRKFRSRSIVHLAHDAAVASRLNALGLQSSVVPLPVMPPFAGERYVQLVAEACAKRR